PGYACPSPSYARSSTACANSDKEPINDNDDNYKSGPVYMPEAALTPPKIEGGLGADRIGSAPRDYNGDGDSNVIEVPAKRQRLEVVVEEERVLVEEGVAAAGGGGEESPGGGDPAATLGLRGEGLDAPLSGVA
ncbi:hypothetical protein L249_8102, partial [Ophiocordyceps polyrhachis-furcata BCC 54312]